MATVNKDFKIKSGLIVEGTTGTINGQDILTKKQADQDYIVSLIGGTATSANEANKVVKRNADGDFAAGVITADLVGDVTGQVSDISNHSTSSLSEGTNLYFTNQRAVTANTGLWDTIGAAAAAQSAAEATASADATGKANAAQAAAELTASNALTSAVNDLEAYADQAEVDAKAYTDTRETAITTAYQNYADAAETDAKAYTDTRETAITTAYRSYADQAELDAVATANAYTDAEVSALVDSAPELLDTLNELAAAIADNPNYATDAAAAVAGRVAKSGDTMTGDLTLPGAPTLTLHAATKGYVDTASSNAQSAAEDYADSLAPNYDAAGSASSAQAAANSYTDGEITTALSTAQGYANTAEQDAKDYADALINDGSNLSTEVWSAYKTSTEIGLAQQAAIDHADALDTDDIAEGTAQYFTDVRAKTSAAALLTGATKTNIAITGDENGLIITAENGVADSTTSDLAEGSNLYFTDSRALGAVSGSNIQPESIDITWVRRENATWTDVPTASQVVCHQAGSGEGSMKYLVRVTASVGGTRHSHVTELLATVDGSNGVAVVEYGTIYTSTEPLATATVLWNGLTNCYELNVTTANNNSEVMVAATMLAVLD